MQEWETLKVLYAYSCKKLLKEIKPFIIPFDQSNAHQFKFGIDRALQVRSNIKYWTLPAVSRT